MSTNPTSPPFETVTANDRGTPVTLVNCVLIIFSSIVVIARAFTRLRITNLKALDDFAIIVALAFAIAQTVCMQLARNHGLGKHRDIVSSEDFILYSKYNYASNILTVLTLAFAKCSVFQLILTIIPKRRIRLACHALDATIVLWLLTSIFALAFQCDLPHPWLLGGDRCVNLTALYDYVGIMNILTDIALIVIPFLVVWDLQLRISKKIIITSLFAGRVLVPGTAIAQLACLDAYLDAIGGDQTWQNSIPAILNQIIVNLSIITACVPSLRRVVTDLQTNQTGLKVSENLEMNLTEAAYGKDGSRPQTNNTLQMCSRNAGGRDRKYNNDSSSSSSNNNRILPYGHNVDNRTGNVATIYSLRGDREKTAARQSSEEHLRQDGIQYTMEVSIEEDDLGSRKDERWTP
ncbi:uncharacterized protein Z518_10777 [Rhinocladiella mackenziei CBS 650.93]|uniref:Rhodopsin domain-containing protein n=1 Tax=Rhinocladiella mackenziei CBS 650.93 TaxID=1442369 RepID=A0A0D2ISX1_9EURO|nr:uncharacterized protein Z518_10777 [Rhinocladiella mackenziei CBS 650.93]KIW99849.1 hypothetical protein Z518_10777 [Rhinocladiella mackenziei CBS 650.93]